MSDIKNAIHILACAICRATGEPCVTSPELEWYELHKPISSEQITFTELFQILRAKFPSAIINLGENYRFLCHYDDVAFFLAQDQTNKINYVRDESGISSHDCNVFANRLLGDFSVPGWADLCFGKVWLSVPSHALNCILGEDKQFWFVEPQTDELLEVNTFRPEAIRFIEM